jgi:DNA-binding response OmpR family regulator
MAVPKSVLVVDDERDLAGVTGDYLNLKGFRTTLAFDGKEAYQKSHNAKFDVIITDFRMPKLSGGQLIHSLRSNSVNSEVPIIVISGYQEEAAAEINALQVPDVKILPKPVDVESISRIITELGLNTSGESSIQKINVDFLNVFIDAVVRTLSEVAEVKDLQPSPLNLLTKAGDLKADLSGVIAIISDKFHGSISLSFSEATYVKVLPSLIGKKAEPGAKFTEKDKDAIGELLNRILSKVTASLAKQKLSIKRTVPSIIKSDKHSLPGSGYPKTMLLTFASSVGEFWITIVLNRFPGLQK